MTQATDAASTEESAAARLLAEEEKRESARFFLGPQRWVLLAAVVVYVIGLFCPMITGVAGWQVVFFTEAASDAGAKVTEYLFAVLSFIGIAVLTTGVLVLRRTAIALAAWMFVTVALAESLFALWLRQTRPAVEDAYGVGPGMILMVAAVIVGTATYSVIALRRSPEQRNVAKRRASTEGLDRVGSAQRVLLDQQRERVAADNPLLHDDRRARAAERHRRMGKN